jgi:uncharacterized protein
MKPKLTPLWLAGICVIVFIIQAITSTEYFILDKSLVLTQPYRIITSIFAHSTLVHLLSNLFALGLFGLILEGRIGPKRVLYLFLGAGILVNIFSTYERSLGASGAIYAILGTLVVLRPKMIIWVEGLPMPTIVAGFVWFFQDFFGIFIPDNVGNIAHLTGLFIGIIYGFTIQKQFADKPKNKKHDPLLEKQLDNYEKQHKLR